MILKSKGGVGVVLYSSANSDSKAKEKEKQKEKKKSHITCSTIVGLVNHVKHDRNCLKITFRGGNPSKEQKSKSKKKKSDEYWLLAGDGQQLSSEWMRKLYRNCPELVARMWALQRKS